MKTIRVRLLLIAVMAYFLQVASASAAESEWNPLLNLNTFTAYNSVKGDEAKYRAHHWMHEGLIGGIRSFDALHEGPDDLSLQMDGRAVWDEDDYAGHITLKKGEAVTVHFDYSEFRKYYDDTGGYYRRFNSMRYVNSNRELSLGISRFALELELHSESLPDLTLGYENEHKEGAKSRLTWGGVREGAVTRMIAPSWQEISEDVDVWEIKAEDEFAGFEWKAEQSWESTRSVNLRHEQWYSSTSSAAADRKIREQATEPKSNVLQTVLSAQRWFGNKLFLSNGYRYSQIISREHEDIYEMNEQGALFNANANAEQVRDAYSDNLYSTHTWVQSLLWKVFRPLGLSVKLKEEIGSRTSSSTYPKDKAPATAAPNGIIDDVAVSEVSDEYLRLGQAVSLRYSAPARASFYAEFESEQVSDDLNEDRRSTTASEVFNRQDLAHSRRYAGTLGMQWIPLDVVTLTTNLRRRNDEIRYNHVSYTRPTSGTAKSVFVDGQQFFTNEWETRVALRPGWNLRPSFRYQLRDKDFVTWGLPNSDIRVKTQTHSDIYTADLSMEPFKDVLSTVSYSLQRAKIETPAQSLNTASRIPAFRADVYTWLFSNEYAWRPDIVFSGISQFTRAANFDDFGDIGMPYGADFTMSNYTFSCRWTPKKDMTVEPKYSYQSYFANDNSEFGNYSANVYWLEVRFNWG